jgi:sortase (surface protein transpeptidase)
MMHARWRFWLIIIPLFILLSAGLVAIIGHNVLFSQQHASQHAPSAIYKVPVAHSLPDHAIATLSGAFLIIPAIGIKAPIEMVGVDKNGHMAVPTRNQWNSVGWYNAGPLPGGVGSAVIDGHLDRPGGLPAVFWGLQRLHNGDVVSVQEKGGHILRFKVIKSAYYTPDNAPLEQIYGNKDGTFLNLVTCAGDWDIDQAQYSQRLVVYTRLTM